MKRRDTFRLIPLTAAGLSIMAGQAAAIDTSPRLVDTGKPMPLALQYPKIILEMLTWIHQNQTENIIESAYAIARTVRKGGTVWINWDQGHSTRGEMFPGRHGMPSFLTHGYDVKKAKNGDLLMASRILSQEEFDDLGKKDIFLIGSPSPWSGDPIGFEHVSKDIQKLKFRPYSDLWIETNITSIGPILRVPGMPAPIGPVSGPVYLVIMWMILADACRALALEGKSASVDGDEPELSDKSVGLINLADPLMDNYLFTVTQEMELIGAELGSIRKIASMAVDTILNGGIVYYYSRYPETFRGEATGRRGGFGFARGLSDGDITGTSKDCVIMGVFQPDDEADIKNLDAFKKIGMRVASIGPITRNFTIPKGRCIHKETEVHAGRMSDTYGLYAIQGFNRKVCPTSGVLMIVINWAISMEIIEQIGERTGGDVPGVHYSGALKWGNEMNSRIRAMVQDRGY